MSLKNINEFENIPISNKLDEVIENSIKKAQHDKKKKFKRLKVTKISSGIAVAMAIFVSSVNISPALANSLSNIPVVSSIVNAVQFHYDKNIETAIRENKVQNICNSKTDKNVTITINNVITDNKEAFITYTLKGANNNEDIKNLLLENIVITDKNNKIILDNKTFRAGVIADKVKDKNCDYLFSSDIDYKCYISSLGNSIENYSKNKETYGTINLINTGNSEIPDEINLKISGLAETYNPNDLPDAKEKYDKFVSKFNRKPKTISGNWDFNIKFDKNLKSQKPEEYKNINFSINNTDFILKYVKIYPTHTKIRVKLGKNKEHQCWAIGRIAPDRSKLPYLIDEKGHKYVISGDALVNPDSDNCVELSFESSHFNNPKELYLVINQLNYSSGEDIMLDIPPTKIKIK